MTRTIELLAPGGDIDSIKAAILAGANAVYCGLERFNARNRAENVSIDTLPGILRLAHSYNCEVFLTLNIIIVENEIPALIRLLNRLVTTKIDGVIVQDLGLFYLISEYFPSLEIHASTQLTTHNQGQIKFLKRLGATRVNLSRELSLEEIRDLTVSAHKSGMATEVFVHGSYCISFSGICYLSSVTSGNSGNRGRCSQPCRDHYKTTAAGKEYPLNLKDNSAYFDLHELHDAGVDSIKIEGRIKKFHYVYTVVDAWHKQLQSLYHQDRLSDDNSDLHKVFNRDFSSGFLKGDISKNMFVDNPRDNSALHYSAIYGGPTAENMERAKRELYDLKTEIISTVKGRIDLLSVARAPLKLTVSGESGAPLKVSVKTPEASFAVLSDIRLENPATAPGVSANKKTNAECLDYQLLSGRLKGLNETEYFIKEMDLGNLQPNLFLPFKELTSIKNKILFVLNGSKEPVGQRQVPTKRKRSKKKINPTLALLLSSEKDLSLCDETEADIYFQLPGSLKNKSAEFIELFNKNKRLIPWFPSVLLGEDYREAKELLHRLQAKRIVTNNSGIAYEACKQGISWIAGPCLNSVNSFSLLSLKEKFNCHGAFISNELSRLQIKSVKKPEDFSLYYSIYHPIVSLTSRQCLFHQVTGCGKNVIDESCMQQCEKSSSITNAKNVTLFLEKTKGNYHSIYYETNFLNTEIVTDIPDMFSGFSIDLRDVKTKTKTGLDKLELVKLFENHLAGRPGSAEELNANIYPTTNSQYRVGI